MRLPQVYADAPLFDNEILKCKLKPARPAVRTGRPRARCASSHGAATARSSSSTARSAGSATTSAWPGWEWFASPAIAEEVSRFCSYRLATGHFPPDAQGWHPYPVEHLPTLIGNAKTHLNIGLRQKARPTPPRKRQPWSREKDAMFCLFVGQGRSAQSIADDPYIQASVDMVYKQAQRLGLSLQNRPRGQVIIRLPAATLAAYEAAAVREGLTRDALIQRRLMKGPSDPDEFTASI